MTWTLVLALSAIAYAFKGTGLMIIGSRQLPATVDRCLGLIPAALVSALIVNSTLSGDDGMVFDARAIGVAAAVLVAARRAIREQKYQEELDAWLRKIREEAFVDIK